MTDKEDEYISVKLYNLARNINISYNEVMEEKEISRSAKRLKNIIEVKLWFLDVTFMVCLVYFTFFDKPNWCVQKKKLINVRNNFYILTRFLTLLIQGYLQGPEFPQIQHDHSSWRAYIYICVYICV